MFTGTVISQAYKQMPQDDYQQKEDQQSAEKTNKPSLTEVVNKKDEGELIAAQLYSQAEKNHRFQDFTRLDSSKITNSRFWIGGSFMQAISKFLLNADGIYLSGVYQTIWSFVNIIQTVFLAVIFSISLAFQQTSRLQLFSYIKYVGIVLYTSDMIKNFITQRQEMGKAKKCLKQIGINYIQNQFIPDLVSLFMLPLSFIFDESLMSLLLLIVALIKLNNNLKSFQKFQYLYITKSEREQYYGLLKVFILNFAIGHVLSILLNLMANINPEQSWYNKIGIKDQPWIQKYIWGYYWGTNIMLSVGFDDVTAANHQQALLLIFIQTISCITLAYNISCVGSIISQMSADNQQKKKKLKYFHKMCKQNKVTYELQTKICNFIGQSYQIKEAFQFDEYEQVLRSLPKNIHSQYIKQCNKHLFQVPFFNSLNKKTILNLAEAVCRRITHPDQIIKRRGEVADFTILQKGTVGLVCRQNKSLLNGQIKNNQKPKILSLDFIKRKILNYDIKSLLYSVVYYLDYQNFMGSLKSCEMDFDLFCVIKDKDDFIMGSNQLYKCTVCTNQFHNKFECPKYHYRPLNQHVITSHFKKTKSHAQKRFEIGINRQYRNYRCLLYCINIASAHKKYLQEYCQQEQIKQIMNIEKYYKQLTKRQVNHQVGEISKFDNFEKQMNKIQQLFVKNSHSETNSGMLNAIQATISNTTSTVITPQTQPQLGYQNPKNPTVTNIQYCLLIRYDLHIYS